VIEGPKLLEEALAAGAAVTDVFAATGEGGRLLARAVEGGARRHDLAPGVMERVADAVTPQPVAAVVEAVDVHLDAVDEADFLVVCVDVRDPGNLGTVLRTAELCGAGGVICCEGSVDLYSPKTVRASAGSLFHVPVVAGGEPLEVLDRLGRWGLRRLGTHAREGTPCDEVDLTGPTAFVLGNEAHGLPPALSPALDATVTVPTAGRTESLNVGMAAAILCYETARQRKARS
jgi:TrmH family RNA methyltransferase